MEKVNLRDLYPDVYKTDHFVEVAEDVLETIRAAERAEAADVRRVSGNQSGIARAAFSADGHRRAGDEKECGKGSRHANPA